MRAMVIDEFGPPEVIHPAEVAEPSPGPGQVLIEVAASSLNPVDAKIRSGKLRDIAPPRPAILHGDVAGTVAAVGEGVSAFVPGDAVYACAGGVGRWQGALARYMVADARLVAHAPGNLPLEQAAVLPLVTITAWEALIDKAGVGPGQDVLVYGGSGGVGSVGVQLARWKGARVVATAGDDGKADAVRALGADEVVDYHAMDAAGMAARFTDGRGFDVVFDTVGGAHLAEAFAAAAYNGTVVTTSSRVEQDLSPLHARGLSLHVVFMLIPLLHGVGLERHGRILREVAALVEQGRLRPLLDDHTFGFSEAAAAHAHWEAGRARGKVGLHQDLVRA